MINFNHGFRCLLLLLAGIACGDRALAAPMPPAIDVVTAPHRTNINESMLWCEAKLDATPDQVLAGGCKWQPMYLRDTYAGVERSAFWMRIALRNSSSVPVSRWLKIGHSRTRERAIYLPNGNRWVKSESGLAFPQAQLRVDPATTRGYLPVTLPAGETVEVLLRVETTSWVDLRTRLLEPDKAVLEFDRRELWVILGAGGLIVAMAFSLLLLWRTRQWVYLSFVIALSGEMLVELHRTAVLQHRFWPANLPVPDTIMPIAGLLILLGWTSFLYNFLPSLRRFNRLLVGCGLLIGAQTVAQLWSIFIDYQAGLRWWSFLFVPTQLYGALLCWLGMRDADPARRRLLGLLLVIFLFGVARVFFAQSLDELGALALEVAPLALILGLPLILFALTESTRELQTQLSRAEARSADQVQFLAQMSHELRTPLDTVLGNAQLLLRGGAKMSEAVARDGLSSIIDSGRHLLGMIDEILGYARGLSGALELRPEPVLLGDFLRAIDSTGQILSARSRNRFVLRRRFGSLDVTQLVVLMDASRVRQVVDNLLVNASRHTREGIITLEYGVVDLDGMRVRLSFSVSDTGEGIAHEDHERIFLPFTRVGRNAHTSGRGVGMGLPTARQLVTLMGGEIAVSSELGKGACFTFDIDIPISTADETIPISESERQPIEAAGYTGERRTILLVDDEQANRRLLAALLIRLGFRVIEADSGRQASELMRNSPEIDLIITDQFMADGDGWDVLETAEETHANAATVLLSAAPPSPPDGWPLNRGFSLSLLKPVDHDLLLQRIGELLDLKWIRDKPLSESASATAARPPVPEMQALARMVDLGEVTAIREWSTHLRRDYPQCSAFADEVERAITMLDFKALEAILGRSSA